MSSVGPVPMPVILIMLALLAAMGLARLWPRATAGDAAPSPASVVLDMLLLGLLCGRLAFVALNFELYRPSPWSVLQIVDGGYSVPVALLSGAGWGLWALRRHPRLRLPVFSSAALGVLLWAGGGIALSQWQAAHMPLPAVQTVDLHGQPQALQQFQGRPLVLNLWATWCGPCRREMPVLAQAQQAHPQIQFAFVNQGETTGDVQAFLSANGLALDNVLLDEASEASTVLGVKAYPSTLFFDAQGRLQELHLGELTAAGLEHKLRQLR
ncbi:MULTISPECIES: TlpA disulfide reductase family protein [Stenotrophomonas]|uniref:TlpA family protein disulfide reductase n=1 Tax=Stenotrophomonas TaxID=40323 RepID=UPI000D53D903|nr:MULTISPECIES: TlpA disulfide reductase family protein [Stenotrophomonas]AWH21775.1 thiol:disulfide interchange protein [Stenotrophomonas sp. ZAC14D2_NAIMI4_6]